MNNIPQVKLGIVAVSRDCFPESLSVNRRKALVAAYAEKYDVQDIYECPVCIVESEIHMVQALEDIKKAGCNALCVYLRHFLQSTSTDRRCSSQQQRKARMTFQMAEVMHTVVC